MSSHHNAPPKVSVLIPCYQHGAYIADTLQSVLAQTMPDFEILIADDSSKDDSTDKIRSISDDRIRSYFFVKNQGTVRTLNFLLKKARGQYIATLGSDDLFHPDKLEKQCAILDTMPQIGAVFSWVDMVDQSGENYVPEKSIFAEVFSEPNRDQAGWIRRFYEAGNRLCHSSALVRKSIYDALGEYEPAYRQLHDLEYWTRVICATEIFVLPERLVSYRRERETVAAVSSPTEKNSIRLANETYFLFRRFLEKMPAQLFKEAFKDRIRNEDIENANVLTAEKFFALYDFLLTGIPNHYPAFEFLMTHFDDPGLIEMLENDYNFTLNDFYEFTSEEFAIYRVSPRNDINLIEE